MAETRCADPTYQLDVDIMMLEYSLHHALNAQFDALFVILAGHGRANDGNGDDLRHECEVLKTAEILLQTFDMLMKMFNHHHKQHTLDTGTLFSAKILEFLILLAHLNDNARSGSSLPTDHTSVTMQDKSIHHCFEHIKQRARWLQARRQTNLNLTQKTSTSARSSELQTMVEKEIRIFAGWQSPTNNHPAHWSTILFANLLPRFMDISAELANVIGEANAKWMDLAAKFMLQAALDLVSKTNGGDQCMQEDIAISLESCFAWGYNDHSSRTNESDQHETARRTNLPPETESDMEEIFCESPSSTTKAPAENSLWTTTRHHYIDLFLLPTSLKSSGLSLDELRARRIAKLKDQYPLWGFLKELADYMQKIWELNCTLTGLPLLVQFEKGRGIKTKTQDGNDDIVISVGKELDEFLTRCGIRLPKTD